MRLFGYVPFVFIDLSVISSFLSTIFWIIAITSDHWRQKTFENSVRYDGLFRKCKMSTPRYKMECEILDFTEDDMPGYMQTDPPSFA